MKAEKAKISDVPEMHKLINYFAERGQMLARSLSEIYENIRDFYVIRKDEHIIACAALHVNWEDLAEIKSVAVSEKHQRQGIGSKLIKTCMEEAKELGIPTVFCLSYTPEFFEKCSFSRIEKNQLPQKVWGECFRCPKFPDCDEVALIYRFEEGSNGKDNHSKKAFNGKALKLPVDTVIRLPMDGILPARLSNMRIVLRLLP